MKTPLPHSRSSLLETALGLGCILAASLSSARAASDTWDGGGADGNWQTTTNWASDTQFPGTNANVFTSLDDATFGATTGAALNLGTTLNLRSLVYGVAGGDAGSFTVGDADDVLNFTTAGGATINAGVTTGQSIGVAGTIINLSTAANSTTTLANNGTGLLTVTGNIVAAPPVGNSLLTVAGSGNTAISGGITETGAGGSALLKTGSGTLTLSGGSVFSGNAALGRIPAAAAGFPLVVREGTLLLNGGTHAPDGEIVIGGVVADGGAGQNAKIQVDSGTFNVNNWLSVGRGNGVGGAISELVANNGAIIQAVNLSAGFNGGNAANLPNTAITLNGTSAMTVTSNNSNFHVAESPGSRCVITLNGSSTLTRNGAASGSRIGMTGTGVLNIASPTASANVRNLIIGQGANGVGAAYNKGTLLGLPDGLFLGDGGGSASYFRNDNGTAPTSNATAGTIAAGIGANSNAVVDVVSGSITGTRVIAGAFNNNSNNAQYNVTGGTLGTGATGFQVGDSNARINKWANVNVTGAGQFTNPTSINLSLANNAANTAILSVAAGGTVTADTITAAGAALAYVNFHNGALQASAGTTASLINNVDRLTVHSGGMTVNTNGFNKNLDAVIASPDADGTTTFGVTSVSLSGTGTGTGYEGRPVVKITGGGGTGATAMADFDLATGQVTGVTLTSPGSGYTSAPTVTVAGGGGTALTATAAIGAVSGGGLTKTGSGTLTLTQANTFTGPIAINGGKLAFGGSYAANAVSVGAAGTLLVAEPANPVGTLTVPSLSLAGGATLELETNGVTSDKIVVTTAGGLSLGTLGINLYESGTATPALAGTSTVFEYNTSFTGGTAGMSILNPRPGYSYAFNDTGSAITVTATAVDTDGDGMTDIYETANGLDPNDATGINGAAGNLDGDFATNLEEFIAGTGANNALSDPLNTDNDGLPDTYEVANFGNTTSQTGASDFDGDFDSNLFEFTNGTTANSAASFSDTDADGLGDGWEIEYFTTIASKDGTLDSDSDLFTDLEEYQYGSNPNDSSFSPAFAKGAHRWSFTGNLDDSIGTSHATIENGPTNGVNVATVGADSVTLTGGAKANSQWVKLGSNLLPARNTPCTIQLWATANATQNWSRIFDFHSSITENLYMSWSVAAGLLTDRVQWNDGGGVNSILVDNTNLYALSTRYHIVMTVEPAATPGSSMVKWYSAPAYDGVTNLNLGPARGSFTIPNSLATLNDTINALGFSPYNDNTPSATYDEVRLWDGALPQWALQGLHEQGTADMTQADTDTDKLPDAFEKFYFGNLAEGPADDTDGDFSSNRDELLFGSDPEDASSSPNDSDADGLPDAWEMNYFSDLDENGGGDPDGDFALNSDELAASTDPLLYTSFPDIDSDGMSDGWETFYVGNLSDNGSSDGDGDSLNLLAEFIAKSLPNDPLSPGAADGDADNDGLPDRWETGWFGATTLATANGAGDADVDGATNLAEYEATSDPLSGTSTPADVNGDGTADQRVFHGFTGPGSGVQDKDGEATPFTVRLANSGTTIPTADPNLDLDTTAGTLALTTSSSDINGQLNMAQLEALGIPLSSLGFTGNQDFRIRAHYVNLPAFAGYDQIGAYVGTSTTSMTRAGAIGPTYASLGVNTAAANDSNPTFGTAGAAGATGRDLTVIIERIGGVWSMSCNDTACNPGVQPAFLDGNASLQAGVFVLDQNVHKTVILESFTAVSFGSSSPDADDDGMDDDWETAEFGNTSRDGTLDFDSDGVSDLSEFAFNGNPSSGSSLGTITSALLDTNANSQKELTLTVAVRSGANFGPGAGGTQVATVNGVTYTIRGSVDLSNFTSAVSHVGSTASGDPDYDLHTFRLDASEGLTTKGFLQAVVTHP